MPTAPEQQARETIDARLAAAGWAVQDDKAFDPSASVGTSIPPLAEQIRIVAEVERRLSVVEELEAVVATNLQRANPLRQAILQKGFTGELVLSTKDSTSKNNS